MSILNVLTITSPNVAGDDARDLIAETGYRELAASKLTNYAKIMASGAHPFSVRFEVGAVKASGTLTGTTVIATDAVIINGLTLTCVASGATADQWNKGATDALTMAALAAVINGHASLAGIVTATSALTVCTVSAARPGLMGNAITLESSDVTIVASVARLAGGVDGTSDVTHYFGSGS